jgi:hypothetical protein
MTTTMMGTPTTEPPVEAPAPAKPRRPYEPPAVVEDLPLESQSLACAGTGSKGDTVGPTPCVGPLRS